MLALTSSTARPRLAAILSPGTGEPGKGVGVAVRLPHDLEAPGASARRDSRQDRALDEPMRAVASSAAAFFPENLLDPARQEVLVR